jgi:hypothetical protein
MQFYNQVKLLEFYNIPNDQFDVCWQNVRYMVIRYSIIE